MIGYPQHIVFILQRLQTGGAERQVSYLAHYLQQQSCKVTVVYFGTKVQEAARWFEDHGIRLVPIGFNEKQILNSDKTITGRLRKMRLLLKMIMFFRKLKPDALLPFTYEPNILIGRYWKYTGAQCCFWNQRDVGLYFTGSDFENKALRNCSAWIANSPASAAFLYQSGIITVDIIPNAVAVIPKTVVPDQTSLRVVMVGNLHVNKDHLTLLKAWKQVVKQFQGQNLQLLLAGGKGNSEEAVKQFIQEHQLESTVQLMGSVSNIPALLSTASIGVLSSRAEGLPNAVLEYMASGLPVVATDNEGCRFALGNDYPFLCEIEDEVQLFQFLAELIQSSELRRQWGERNLQRISDTFSIAKMGDAFYSLLEQKLRA
jgi:glycosyltransferase involved in cell wall biosynthesis